MIVTVVNSALGGLFIIAGAIWGVFTTSSTRLAANGVGTGGKTFLRVFAGVSVIAGVYFILAQPALPLPVS